MNNALSRTLQDLEIFEEIKTELQDRDRVSEESIEALSILSISVFSKILPATQREFENQGKGIENMWMQE